MAIVIHCPDDTNPSGSVSAAVRKAMLPDVAGIVNSSIRCDANGYAGSTTSGAPSRR
jgi:hypothetical protein